MTLTGVILSFSTAGEAMFCTGASEPTVGYCDIFGNAGGDSLCGNDAGGNISQDPLFCDIWKDDFSLCANSPCLVPAAPDGQIGRFGSGCESCGATGVDGPGGANTAPAVLSVANSPNPFGPTTTLHYDLPDHTTALELSIYNLKGQKVRTLANGPSAAGRYRSVWDGRDDRGAPVASGVYFYVLTADGERVRGRTVLLR